MHVVAVPRLTACFFMVTPVTIPTTPYFPLFSPQNRWGVSHTPDVAGKLHIKR